MLAGVAGPALAGAPQSTTAYVRARAADADGRSDVAARSYGTALAAAPDNPLIAVRAYREALAAGDMALARAAAATLVNAGVAPADTAVLAIAGAIREKRWDAARAAAARTSGGPLAFIGPIVEAWIDRERGERGVAERLGGDGVNVLARRFNAENRALLLIAAGRERPGIAELRALLGRDAGNLDLRIAGARLLAATGHRRDGEALLAGDDPALTALRTGLERKAETGAAFGVARLYVRLAAELADGDARPLAIVLTRAALELDPRDDRARLILAQALSGEGAQGPALAAIDATDPHGAFAATARGLRIAVLSRLGRDDEALALARKVSDAPGAGSADAQRLGDLLTAAGRFGEGADAYGAALARAGAAADWTLYLQRGGALEQAGRWDEAEAMLTRAVELAPQEAVALNYLGYARIERGQDVAAARAMLERAARLKPDDAAITDSLGWAYVRAGEVDRGLPLLERAARAEPGDVTIHEHLGDAYWHAGRRYEARYAWAAAKVHADAGDAKRLADKLSSGLTVGAR